ncbi:TPA: Zn-dependent oxidoreductase [Escherichia coli]|nr:D-mannonate dehydratase ManD [Escherichia coli]EGK4156397.1 Zn-dependent oxidoreductase [Escherichia coli]NUB64005.1 Zn-dependent oxidoreductase [Escherichia coli]NUD81090.1 Zn-dependent oxidoreductase [Escherichia coli]HBA3885690.1 Zn-dependent oxidoreductase [Escherichia coli]HBA3917860.1 Zn-dependent oxidoreductase [Escherichia coli]
MKIVKAEVFVTCPGRNFVTLKITTEDGITGLGDATLNGRELSVASYLQDHLCPQLIGRDAHRIEDIWQFFYKGAYWRRGPVTMSAISAVDMALWDIKAKAANMPLYQLLGGASREGVMVYCHTTGHSIDEALDDYARHQELGFKAIRVQCGIPGMKTTYGMSKGKGLAYEPATKGQWPEEQLWSTEKYLDFMPKLFDAVRNKFGFNEHLLHDMHHRLTPIEAARFGKSIEDYRMFWMEDPTPAENQECFRLIRQHTVTPIAVGEVFNSIWDCKQLIEEQLIDYIRTTLTHAGGITGMRRIADFASLYQVRTGSHGPSDLSPVCMAAALHFDLWVPNFGVQEYMGYSEQMLEVFPHNWTFDNGYMHPGDKPGLGIEFDEKLAAKYPRVIGHEFFGVIDAVGEGVESARVGERVAVDPVVSCGHCYPCSIGKPNVCTTLAVLGVHADGGFSEYAVVPAKNAWKIPEAVADQYAVMIEPFTIAANVTGHGQPTENDTVLVYGAGPIGLTIVQVLKGVYNVKNVIVADRIDERLEKAKESGADWAINNSQTPLGEIFAEKGIKPTLIIDAACHPSILKEAVTLASPAARIVLMGFSSEPSEVIQQGITGKELSIFSSRLNANKFPVVIDWLSKGLIKPEKLITHTFDFQHVADAISLFEQDQKHCCKVLLTFSE